MKTLLSLLRLPWLARVPSGTGLAATILTMAVLSITTVHHLPALDGLQQLGVAVLLLVVAVVWATTPAVLSLKQDAMALRIPAAAREADRCVLLHVALTVFLPALVLGALFGHAVTWLVSLALVASALFALNLLPIWFGVGSVAVIAGLMLSGGNGQVPFPGDPRFLAWATPVTIALCVACVQRWSALGRVNERETNRWWIPGIQAQRLRRLNVLRGGAYSGMPQSRHGKPGKPRDDVLSHRIGPRHPVASIRIATSPLAGPTGRKTLRWSILCGVLVVAMLLILLTQNILPMQTRAFIASLVPIYGFLFLSEALTPLSSRHARRLAAARWTPGSPELPLLALLPHLGAPGTQARSVLYACLLGRLFWLGGIAAALVATAAALHMPIAIYPILAIVACCGLAMDATVTLHVLIGRPLQGSLRVGAAVLLLVLYGVCAGLWDAAIPDAAPSTLSPHGPILMLAIFILWAAWLVVLAVLARRGWRRLQRRPHPFLANPLW